MVTKQLIEKLKRAIEKAMALPLLKRVPAAQNCVVDSVVVIESLNNDVIALNERIKQLEYNANELTLSFLKHVKRGH